MLKPSVSEDWPEIWRKAYEFDLIEVFGEWRQKPSYARAYNSRYAQALSMVEERLPSGSSIIDVAAAQGNFSLGLAERGYDVTWNDLRGELAGYVKLKHERGALSFIEGDAFQLARADFDAALITEVIEHVAHPDQFLEKIATLVKPGGYIFMTTPNGGYFHNRLPRFSECADPSKFEAMQFKPDADGHIFLLHEDEIATLAENAKLEVVEIRLFNNPLSAGHTKLDFIHKWLPQTIVERIEAAARGLTPRPLARRAFAHLAVCFRKPAG